MVYVDGDNVPLWLVEEALRDARAVHDDVRARAFKDWTVGSNDKLRVILEALGVETVQVDRHADGKNSTDIALAVEAVDRHHMDPVDHVVLVGSDGDFVSLVKWLASHGVATVGYGCLASSGVLASVCSDFRRFDPTTRTRVETGAWSASLSPEEAVGETLAFCAGSDGWVPLSRFGAMAVKRHGLRSKDVGARTWTLFFHTNPDFECRGGRGDDLLVRATVTETVADRVG